MAALGRILLATCFAIFASACAGAEGEGSVLSPKAPAQDPVVPRERAAIAAGEVVARPLEFERGSSKYVGGIASGLVPATPAQVLAALADASALRDLLPRTKRATLLDDRDGTRHVELCQGNSFVEAKYTVSIESASQPGELLFSLDRSRHHDIDDVYGYFRVERFDDRRSVVTIAAAVDVGSDLTNFLFGRKVQDVILSTPKVMRDYFARTEVRARDPRVAFNDSK